MEKYQYTIHALFLKYRLENFNKAYFYANKKEKYKYWKAKELACSRKGDWRMEKVLNQILSNKIIVKLGYTSMLDYHLIVCEN